MPTTVWLCAVSRKVWHIGSVSCSLVFEKYFHISLKKVCRNQKEADYFFWLQMLMGDATDGIIGIKGIGPKKAEKLLDSRKNLFIGVAREYLTKSTKQDFKTNYELLKLGLR